MVAGFTSKQHLEDASKCFCIVSFPCDRRCPLAIRRDEEVLQADLYFRLICRPLKTNVRKLMDERWKWVHLWCASLTLWLSFLLKGKGNIGTCTSNAWACSSSFGSSKASSWAYGCFFDLQLSYLPPYERMGSSCQPPPAPVWAGNSSMGWWAPELMGRIPAPLCLFLFPCLIMGLGSGLIAAVLRALRSRGCCWDALCGVLL